MIIEQNWLEKIKAIFLREIYKLIRKYICFRKNLICKVIVFFYSSG